MARKQPSNIKSVHDVTTGTVIRLEQPSSGRKKKPNVAEVIIAEVNPVTGFSSFLKEYAVVGLAIGFIVGLQAQELVKTLVTSFIDPLFKLFFVDRLQDRVFYLSFDNRTEPIYWGAFARTLLYFLFVLGIIFVLVKALKLDKFGKASSDDIAKIKPKKM